MRANKRVTAHIPHLGAFESTKLADSGTDILGTTRHIERWRDDLNLLLASGIRSLRYSVPWHRIERVPGRFDFAWLDGPMQHMERNGMTPILDPLHHVSIPDWLTGGMASPDFADLYQRFVLQVADRYPWVTHYTVCNEPLATTVLCGERGIWHPFGASQHDFVRIAVNVARTMCQVSAALRARNPNVRLIHIDTCETHRALDKRSERWVEHANHRRFLLHDIVLGRVSPAHPIYSYLRQHGAKEADLRWFADHPAHIDVLGLDYYMHCEMEWYWDTQLQRANISWPTMQPVGFAAIGREYGDRFRRPLMLTETNIRGTFQDRLTWLKLMEEQVEELAATHPVLGFCWYPSIDSTDWCHVCTKATGQVDPQGIWCLDASRWKRHATELSWWYGQLASGKARAADLPAYRLAAPLDHDARGFTRLMQNWEWIEQEVLPAAA